jgi:nicotinamide mononucleotide transporter
MNEIIDFFISPYKETPAIYILIEFTAMAFGILSVFFAKKENILVYPTGIISTVLYVYLLSKWQMYGDLIINIYYTLMSIYGWWVWSRIVDDQSQKHIPITRINYKDKLISLGIFVFTASLVIVVYRYDWMGDGNPVMSNKMGFSDSFAYVWEHLSSGKLSEIKKVTPYLDTFTTAAAFVAMLLMATKKLESWLFWIVVNIASVPLYFIKGYGFTGIQYFIFLVLAFYGYKEWKELMQKEQENL